MPSRKNKPPLIPAGVSELLTAIAALVAIVAYGFTIWCCCFGPWDASYLQSEAAKNRQWTMHTAVVVKVQPVISYEGRPENRPVQLRYADYFGRTHISGVVDMPWTDTIGTHEPVLVGKDGQVMFVNDQQNQFSDPRTFGSGGIISMGVLDGAPLCALGGCLLYGVMGGGYLVARQGRRSHRSIVIMSLRIMAAPRTRWCVQIVDAIKRRRHLRARKRAQRPTSAFYRGLVTLQNELARMDPIPPVLAARERVLDVMSRVLTRDYIGRLEEIDGLLEGMDEDVRQWLTARILANAELTESNP